jgi:hypothetical protein
MSNRSYNHSACSPSTTCRVGQIDPRTGRVVVHNARFRSQGAPTDPAPRGPPPAPRAPPAPRRPLREVIAVLSLPPNTTTPQRLVINENQPEFAEVLRTHTYFTFNTIEVTFASPFTGTEQGMVRACWGTTDDSDLTDAGMLARRASLWYLGANNGTMVQRFDEAVGRPGRAIPRVTGVTQLPGVALWFTNTSASAKLLQLICTIEPKLPRTMDAQRVTVPAPGPLPTRPTITIVPGTKNLYNLALPVNTTIDCPESSRACRFKLEGGQWTQLAFNDEPLTTAAKPGLRSVFHTTSNTVYTKGANHLVVL